MNVAALERSPASKAPAGTTGLRLYTRAPVTVPWLSRTVIPVARTVRALGSGSACLRRGWLHGPHVDIVALGLPDQGARDPDAPGRDLPWDELAARLDAGPLDADSALTDEAYLAQAREFGRLEAVPPPYLPLRPHGLVEFIGAGRGGSREARLGPFRDAAFSAMAGPLMQMTDEIAADPDIAAIRLAEAFAALADTHLLGPGYGVFSFRSHAEAFLSWAAPARDVRPAFAARLAEQAPRLRPVVEQRVTGAPGPAAAAWRTAFAYCAGFLDQAVADGMLTPDLLDSVTAGVDRGNMGPPAAPTTVPRGDTPDSAFHRAIAASGVIARPPKWFASYRLLINLFYEQLPLLTVSPMQRYYMCYAIAELVDEVLGESWRDRLRRQQERGTGEAA